MLRMAHIITFVLFFSLYRVNFRILPPFNVTDVRVNGQSVLVMSVLFKNCLFSGDCPRSMLRLMVSISYNGNVTSMIVAFIASVPQTIHFHGPASFIASM